jgi:hypothetical protein
MLGTMQVIKGGKITRPHSKMHLAGENTGQKSMHPDDFEAHFAWVTAKRFYELSPKTETFLFPK